MIYLESASVGRAFLVGVFYVINIMVQRVTTLPPTENAATTPYVIGLTGNIGTGKSTVLSYLATKGVAIIDADKLAHTAMKPDGPAYRPVVEVFSTLGDIVAEDGQINRKALGEIVFANPDALRQLESIVLPAVFELTKQCIAEASADFIILEAIKLLDGGKVVELCSEIWVVTATAELQIKRLQENRNMNIDSIQQRMDAQSSQAEKMKCADRIIRNDGSLFELHKQLDQVWTELQK